jgi:hypothetical protein
MLNWRLSGNRGPGDDRRRHPDMDAGAAMHRLADANLMPFASSFYELTRPTRHGSKAVPNTCMSLKCHKICAPVGEICAERGPPITQTSTLRYTLA